MAVDEVYRLTRLSAYSCLAYDRPTVGDWIAVYIWMLVRNQDVSSMLDQRHASESNHELKCSCSPPGPEHEGTYETSDDAVLILAEAVSRIVGKGKFPEDGKLTKTEAISQVRVELCDYVMADIHSFKSLAEELLWVCFPGVEKKAEDFGDLFDTNSVADIHANHRIEQLKGVLFTPFKFIQDKGWNPRALQLALRAYRCDFEFEPNNSWNIPPDWTPFGYGVVLDFLMKCCVEYYSQLAVRIEPGLLNLNYA